MLTGKTKIAFDAFTSVAARVFAYSRTPEAKTSDDLKLRKLFIPNGSGKYGNFKWDSDYAQGILRDACAVYNAQMESQQDHLTTDVFASTYLPHHSVNRNRKNWLSWAKLADYTSPLGLIPNMVLNSSKIGIAGKNEEKGLGIANLFREDYESENLKRLFVLLEDLTLKFRNGEDIELADIPEDLLQYFSLGDKMKSILFAIKNFMSAEKLQEVNCKSTIGGDAYTPEEIAELFQGEVKALLEALDAFLEGRDIDGSNGRAALRKFEIVSSMNDFLIEVEAFYQGIRILLDQVVEEEVYPVSVGVLPATSNITNQCCPGQLENHFGCKCQIEQPFQNLSSFVHILSTGTVLDMDAGLATPGSGHSNGYVADAAEYAVPLELGTSKPSHRVICQIKFMDKKACPLGSYRHSFSASRNTSSGVYPHIEYAPPTSPHLCKICRNVKRDDFAGETKTLNLHRFCRLVLQDTALMLFNSPYARKIQEWLKREGAECLEDVFGYLKDRPPESGMYQRKVEKSGLGEQVEGKATDVEHPKGRFNHYYHLLNATFGCSHTSNEVFTQVREDADDFCYGFMENFSYETLATRKKSGKKKRVAKKKKATAPKKSAGKKRARSELALDRLDSDCFDADTEIVDQPTKKVKYTITQCGEAELRRAFGGIADSVSTETEQKSKKLQPPASTSSSGPTIQDTSKLTQQEASDVEMKPVDVESAPSNEASTCHSPSSVVATTKSNDTQLTLFPIRDTDDLFSSSINNKQAYFEGGVASIVSGATPNYNAPRNTIKVTKEVKLGRNITTGIVDSFISRDLCSINLNKSRSGSVCAFLKMSMPHEIIDGDGGKRYGHAVHLNGEHLDIEVGVEKELHSGDILSLFGPLGFAYRVEL